MSHRFAFVEVRDRLLQPNEARMNWNLDGYGRGMQTVSVLHLEG